jgi:hypothetical protein
VLDLVKKEVQDALSKRWSAILMAISLQRYTGGIHLVYGEHDRYIAEEIRQEVIEKVREKGQPVMILPGQNHSLWSYDCFQQVFQHELKKLDECFF